MPDAHDDRHHGRPPRLPTGAAVAVGILLLVPCVALAVVPLYSRKEPVLAGWPFFYWYQLLWVVLTPIMTYSAYVIIKRARRER